MSLSEEAAEAIETAERIVNVQGNIFIKELLRQKKRDDSSIRIGVTKPELLANLKAAIVQGTIVLADLDAWVREVEGWGKQHAYLYRVPAEVAAEPFWKTPAALENKLRKSGLAKALSDSTRLDFPESLALASAGYTKDRFEASWHERFELWNREKDRNLTGIRIDGDLYEFRAYRQEFSRSVMRFVLIPSQNKAALFIQIPLADSKHDAARQTARDTLEKVFAWDKLEPVSISDAIKSLDKAELKDYQAGTHGHVQARSTKFAARGATIEFEADPANQAWKTVKEVREVRRALKENAFTGDSGKFRVQLRAGLGMNRDVIISLNGEARRIYLHSQMTADEVWVVLDQIM